jgi:hypothetical protein
MIAEPNGLLIDLCHVPILSGWCVGETLPLTRPALGPPRGDFPVLPPLSETQPACATAPGLRASNEGIGPEIVRYLPIEIDQGRRRKLGARASTA